MPRGQGWAYRFGEQQLNVHGPGISADPLARIPVAPGNSDLCFVWDAPIEQAVAHLAERGVPLEEGPVERHGAGGRGRSVYFRDPDGTLLEFFIPPVSCEPRPKILNTVEPPILELVTARFADGEEPCAEERGRLGGEESFDVRGLAGARGEVGGQGRVVADESADEQDAGELVLLGQRHVRERCAVPPRARRRCSGRVAGR